MRKIAIAAVACALAGLTVPASAFAIWQHHSEALAKDANVQYTGQLQLTGIVGSATCQIVAEAQLLAGQTTAQVNKFEVDPVQTPTNECHVNEKLSKLGCTDVKKISSFGFPWTAHATSKQTIAITSGIIEFHLHGQGVFCPYVLQLAPGTVHLTMTTQSTWTDGTIQGQLSMDLSTGSTQPGVLFGTGKLTPSGTYGVA